VKTTNNCESAASEPRTKKVVQSFLLSPCEIRLISGTTIPTAIAAVANRKSFARIGRSR